jgi:pimeloyl-ACP methyl ester carboxylesterase
MSDYLGMLGDETDGWQRIRYTQRGLPPSTTQGPFTVAQHVADAVAVLDGLDLREAVVLGHSWGGFLGALLAMEHPDRVRGLLLIDPLGIVGDGGYHHFEQQLFARTPEDVRQRAEELDQRVMAGEGTEEDSHESFRLVWPAYFHDPARAVPVPDVRHSVETNSQTFEDLFALLEAGALPGRAAAYGGPVEVVYGLGSPFPPEASIETAHTFPQGSATGVPDAGHFCWVEQPGCVADALVRLGQRL